MLIARYSAHIQDDIKRNWSSWNFGAEGFEGDRSDLQAAIDEAISTEGEIHISGFDIPACDLNGREISEGKFRELYHNYWVAVDLCRGEGLSCHVLESETIEEALAEIAEKHWHFDGTGEGQTVDCKNAKILYSAQAAGEFGLHILEIE